MWSAHYGLLRFLTSFSAFISLLYYIISSAAATARLHKLTEREEENH